MLLDRIVSSVDEREEMLSALALDIWDHPQLALDETYAAAEIKGVLTDAGFTIESGVGGMETAFVARFGDEGPVVGTMGEYDALPKLSQQATAQREPVEPGAPGHGCGHNLFGVGSLGAALAVRDAIAAGELTGSVIYFGTPAEEVGIGKPFMIRDGAFSDVDAIVSWHPGWFTSARKGSSLAVDSWEVTYNGVSAHAAAEPHAGRSALDALQLANMGIEHMREHVPDATRIHYVIKEGGAAPNVVPPVARGEYLVRAPTRSHVEAISEWVTDIFEGAAMMADVDVTIRKTAAAYNVLPNHALGDLIVETMDELGGFSVSESDRQLAAELKESIGDVSGAIAQLPTEDAQQKAQTQPLLTDPVAPNDVGKTGSYSTDSGDVSHVVPLGRMTTATFPVGTPLHSWQAVAASGSVGTNGMLYAAKTIGGALATLLSEPARIEDAQNEFADRTAEIAYTSGLPADVTPADLVDR
ncbi:amidohydrolase [Natronocalculus amylovorans]|uniref:Amidohydrolase n=1 Tax=Natronocalculus amylovorans TaxID=2917812 RepID=A0AAE3FZX0_9EURY|nr:amidohydrolase [Natronocalculus amylovorans]MCL9817699.1 amidohydrolase [Natronocalculus amylovorans]